MLSLLLISTIERQSKTCDFLETFYIYRWIVLSAEVSERYTEGARARYFYRLFSIKHGRRKKMKDREG